MQKLLRTAILITFGMLIISIIDGCGDDDPPEQVVEPPQVEPPQFEEDIPPHTGPPFLVSPAPGTVIPPNTEFSLTFVQGAVGVKDVVAVAVNGVGATRTGDHWTVSLTLQEREVLTLNVSWTNRDGSPGGTVTGPYTVKVPGTPPRITKWTVGDGDADVDPAPINQDGLRYDFDEPIIGTIKLTDEAGADLNWIATVAGRTATLTPIAGQELANETTYKVEIDVHDGAGDRLQITITFATKPE